MRKMLRRLSHFFDEVIQTDYFIPTKRFKPATLKDIFDNLRYYAVLAFMWAGLTILLKDSKPFAIYAAVVLGIFLALLAFAVIIQTTLILLICAIGLIGAIVPPRVSARARRRIRKGEPHIKVAVLALCIPVGLSAWAVVAGLVGAVIRTGAL